MKNQAKEEGKSQRCLQERLSLQSPIPEICEELVDGATQSISPSEGLVHHTANKGQGRFRVSVAIEASPKPGPGDEQGSPPAQTLPRLLFRVLSQASVSLSTLDSDLGHSVTFPLSRLEDLETTKGRD